MCGPPTTTRETMQFIRLQKKYVDMVVKVHSDELDAPKSRRLRKNIYGIEKNTDN